MNRRLAAPFLHAALICALAAGCREHGAPPRTVPVARGDLESWTVFEAGLLARRALPVMSTAAGSATLIELAEEGRDVRQGDIVARFDAAQAENDLVKAESAFTLAKSALNSLEQAEIPLERQALDAQALDARYQYETEKDFLAASRDLLAQGLVSEAEIRQQELKVAGLQAALAQTEARARLTAEHVHPSKLARARAELAAAEQQRAYARSQVDAAILRAPGDGRVVLLPLSLNAEYRPARVGDAVFRNQPFLLICDMHDLVADAYLAESEVGRLAAGQPARIVPLAFPDIELAGTVETVGSLAQSRPGYPAWQKFFPVRLRLERADPRLRTGMTLRVRVRTGAADNALVVPRAAVDWSDGAPVCTVVRDDGREERRALTLGVVGEQSVEVRSGLQTGERVELP